MRNNKNIHTTIGIYADDSYKINGVTDENLKEHIVYNISNRPGRALFVDGKCLNEGYLTVDEIKKIELKIKNNEFPLIKKDTAPYV